MVRASLRKRGWIEKHFKGCPAVVSNSNKEKASSSDNEDDDGDSTEKGGKSDNSGNEDDDGDESTGSAVWNAGYEGEDCEYSLLVSSQRFRQYNVYFLAAIISIH